MQFVIRCVLRVESWLCTWLAPASQITASGIPLPAEEDIMVI